ncbi:homoserine kinase [Evansella caseinilytica]|uniref:Homoserine kinase n=1 Tax=Evansella caseinilytica TaxID=1503961 RepID=A0A1H3UZP8_9BACI|nr:homoserine kinase [Evansella caseinilytica]SDZ67923.1 homoserine kinase [Evansella caseinilytica]
MSPQPLFTITVPGSTANLGPGFDSIGLAVDRYLTLHVEKSDEWLFTMQSANLDGLPTGKDNLIYQVAAAVAEEAGHFPLPSCHVTVSSDIPLSRGMGSSAAAIVAGIELADQLLELKMTLKEKSRRASLWESHPDNVTASLYGGLVIGSHRDDDTDIIFGGYPDFDIIAVIPDYELKTKASRTLLPEQLSFADAVTASSVSNVLVAALLQKNWATAGKMMSKDLFHQNYRMPVIPELQKAGEILSELDVYGAALSGAGPIVLFFAPEGKGEKVKQKLAPHFQEQDVQLLKVDRNGVKVSC